MGPTSRSSAGDGAALPTTVVGLRDPRLAAPAGTLLWTTLEGEHPTGSLKDRLVVGELTELLASGALRPGDEVSEVSAGSTARALAHHCHRLGLACTLFVPTTMPAGAVKDLRALGAAVHQVTREEAYPTYERYCAEHATHAFDQLFDATKSRHYVPLGAAAAAAVGRVDAVLGAVGTGHSLLGTAAGIAPRPAVISVEPDAVGAIPGVRNVSLERYGPDDPCTPEQFDERVVVAGHDLLAGDVVNTAVGPVQVGASFRLVLSALPRLDGSRYERVLLLGAENRRAR